MSVYTLALCLVVCAAASAMAQPVDFRIGAGVAVNPVTIMTESDGSNGNLSVPVHTAAVFMPMLFSGYLFVEPQFSLLSLSETKTTKNDAGIVRGTLESNTTGLVLGSGFFYKFALDKATQGYVGGRFGIISASSTSSFTPASGNGSTDVSYTQLNFFYGPALGGEFFLSAFMSLGMEAGLNVLSYGSVTYKAQPSINDPSRPDISQTAISTSALVFARLYLN